jgi:hypothetical protein
MPYSIPLQQADRAVRGLREAGPRPFFEDRAPEDSVVVICDRAPLSGVAANACGSALMRWMPIFRQSSAILPRLAASAEFAETILDFVLNRVQLSLGSALRDASINFEPSRIILDVLFWEQARHVQIKLPLSSSMAPLPCCLDIVRSSNCRYSAGPKIFRCPDCRSENRSPPPRRSKSFWLI